MTDNETVEVAPAVYVTRATCHTEQELPCGTCGASAWEVDVDKQEVPGVRSRPELDEATHEGLHRSKR